MGPTLGLSADLDVHAIGGWHQGVKEWPIFAPGLVAHLAPSVLARVGL